MKKRMIPNSEFLAFIPFLHHILSWIIPSFQGNVGNRPESPKTPEQRCLGVSSIFVGNTVVHEQNLDTWEFGKGALRES
jgi:hypothetical protein